MNMLYKHNILLILHIHQCSFMHSVCAYIAHMNIFTQDLVSLAYEEIICTISDLKGNRRDKKT